MLHINDVDMKYFIYTNNIHKLTTSATMYHRLTLKLILSDLSNKFCPEKRKPSDSFSVFSSEYIPPPIPPNF